MEINGQSDFFGHKLKRTVAQQSSFIEFKSKQEFKEDATKVAVGQDREQWAEAEERIQYLTDGERESQLLRIVMWFNIEMYVRAAGYISIHSLKRQNDKWLD